MVYLENEPYILSDCNTHVLANTSKMAVTRIDGIVEINPNIMESLYEQIASNYGKCYIETIDEFINPGYLDSIDWGNKPLVHLVSGKVVIYAREIESN